MEDMVRQSHSSTKQFREKEGQDAISQTAVYGGCGVRWSSDTPTQRETRRQINGSRVYETVGELNLYVWHLGSNLLMV